MGRKVQVRASYENDSRFLSRLIESYAKDPKIPKAEKRALISHARSMIITLTQLDMPELRDL